MSATIAITGASSFAARPLLHALLRREPRQVVLCDPLDDLAELQWWSRDTSAALPDLHGIQWLIHGDTVRSEALLQANGAVAVRRNILATQKLLASLPECGVSLLLLSSHLAAERRGVAGATLAAAEALVAQWAATHPSCPVQVWRLPSAFDPEATGKAMASELSAAWLREQLSEALIDQLLGSGSAAGGQRLIAAASPLSVDQPLLHSQALADAVVWPAQPIQAWLASLAEPLDRYDNAVVRDALRGLWT